MNLTAWNSALADVLLPADINAGRPVRLACDDHAVALAARTLGIRVGDPAAELVRCLRAEGLLDEAHGVKTLASERLTYGDPPAFLAGLAVLVVAASRMVSDDRQSMRAYYVRLAELLGTPLHASWPPVPGVPQLSGRFVDLAEWMQQRQAGRRGLLDLPEVHRYVDVPIHQTILRTGDRAHLGAFFARAGRLIAAGWDPVHQLRRWGNRHQLSSPIQQIISRDDLAPALAAALRSAHRSWDGTILDKHGRRVLSSELSLHLLPGRIVLGVDVQALDAPTTATASDGGTLELVPGQSTELPLSWLTRAETGPVNTEIVSGERIRVLPGPVILFEITELGPRAISSAIDDPVWALTCSEALIAEIEPERRYGAALPAGWALLCDVDPSELPDDLRDAPVGTRGREVFEGGLPLAEGVWLIDHPPQLAYDLDEPAPVVIDGIDHGYVESHESIDLSDIAHSPGLHSILVADRSFTLELVERGPRSGIGSLSVDVDGRRVHHGPTGDVASNATTAAGARVGPIREPWEPPLIVRYRAQVDVIDEDGTVRTLVPPAAPAPWLAQVGLTPGDAWEIPDPSKAVWICVDAAAGRFVVCRRADDVSLTDGVLDVASLYENATVIDRTTGGASDRWQRIVAAVRAEDATHAG